MDTIVRALAALGDEQLLLEVHELASGERTATARLVASLAEVEGRRLHLAQGYSSLFTYCVQRLHLSEAAAYSRIAAARAARKYPLILEKLADGSITLTTVNLLSASLTAENHRDLLDAATHKGRSEVEQQVAALRPRPAVPATIRKLPAPRPRTLIESAAAAPPEPTTSRGLVAAPNPAPAPAVPAPAPSNRRPLVVPLAPQRYKVQFTISQEAHEKLRRAQGLLRHVIPNGDLALVFERALLVLVADLERRKLGETSRPRPSTTAVPGSRQIPAAIRREVSKRDGGRCAFVGTDGRCTERGFLEFHHVVPFAEGGETTTANLELRCKAHNAYEAQVRFGRLFAREQPVAHGHGRGESLKGYIA